MGIPPSSRGRGLWPALVARLAVILTPSLPWCHTGFQARSKDQEILEEGGGAGPSTLPRRDHEQGGGAGLSKLDVFCFELSKLFVNSGATDIVLVTLSSTTVERAVAQRTSRWAMARGHRLNTSIVLAAVHGLSGLFRTVSAVEPFTLSPPSHSVPVPNRPSRLRGRKATLNQMMSLENDH